MQIVLVVCGVLLTLVLVVVAVYAVMTLDQARRTLRSVETLSQKMNDEVDKVQTVTSAAATVANAFSGTMGKSAALAFSLVRGFLKKRNGGASEAAEESAEKEEI